MSMMHCSACDRIKDTDDDLDGLWEDPSPFRWWCTACVERGDDEALLVALKAQEPERYREITE